MVFGVVSCDFVDRFLSCYSTRIHENTLQHTKKEPDSQLQTGDLDRYCFRFELFCLVVTH